MLLPTCNLLAAMFKSRTPERLTSAPFHNVVVSLSSLVGCTWPDTRMARVYNFCEV